MRYSGKTYANGWYAHLNADADDGLGALIAEWAVEEPPMEPRQRAERREWLAQREAPVPELVVQE